jgi:hypothetical protein
LLIPLVARRSAALEGVVRPQVDLTLFSGKTTISGEVDNK